MSIVVDLPFTDDEMADVDHLVADARALGPTAPGKTLDSLLRMICQGGMLALASVSDVQPPKVPPGRRSVTLMSSDARELEALERKFRLGREEMLRLVVLDGLAYVTTAMTNPRNGQQVALPPGTNSN